ncbi:MAG: hypothetical protein ACKO1V_11715, partial [Cyanobium sp.]
IVHAPETCLDGRRITTPIAAVVSFNYQDDTSTSQEKILFSTSVSDFNRFEAVHHDHDRILSEEDGGSTPPIGWPKTICRDGTMVWAPKTCRLG